MQCRTWHQRSIALAAADRRACNKFVQDALHRLQRPPFYHLLFAHDWLHRQALWHNPPWTSLFSGGARSSPTALQPSFGGRSEQATRWSRSAEHGGGASGRWFEISSPISLIFSHSWRISPTLLPRFETGCSLCCRIKSWRSDCNWRSPSWSTPENHSLKRHTTWRVDGPLALTAYKILLEVSTAVGNKHYPQHRCSHPAHHWWSARSNALTSGSACMRTASYRTTSSRSSMLSITTQSALFVQHGCSAPGRYASCSHHQQQSMHFVYFRSWMTTSLSTPSNKSCLHSGLQQNMSPELILRNGGKITPMSYIPGLLRPPRCFSSSLHLLLLNVCSRCFSKHFSTSRIRH